MNVKLNEFTNKTLRIRETIVKMGLGVLTPVATAYPSTVPVAVYLH